MKQDVLITLRGIQQAVQEQPETIELVTRGHMTGRNGKYAISYEETELTGTKGVTTTFLIFNPQRVVLTRTGAVQSRMVFQEGIQEESLYDLGFGGLLIGTRARRVEVNLNDRGGTIIIDYIVEVEQSVTTHNIYELLIEPVSAHETTQ